jgi:hypothetical protein
MTAYNFSDYQRSRRIAFIHGGAISVAFVAGTFALVALLLGSPFEFGSALALCGGAWIVAHIAEQFAEQQRARRNRALLSERRAPSAHFAPGYMRFDAPARRHRREPVGQRTLSTV